MKTHFLFDEPFEFSIDFLVDPLPMIFEIFGTTFFFVVSTKLCVTVGYINLTFRNPLVRLSMFFVRIVEKHSVQLAIRKWNTVVINYVK